jgi:hypothetical protein
MLGCRTMRMICNSRFCAKSASAPSHAGHAQTHLEALVLQHALDGRIFATGRQFGLEDDAERAVADDLALCVGQVLVLARLAVLDLLADDFCGVLALRRGAGCGHTYRPFLTRRRPRAGSCSLFGVMQRDVGRQKCAGCWLSGTGGGGQVGASRAGGESRGGWWWR